MTVAAPAAVRTPVPGVALVAATAAAAGAGLAVSATGSMLVAAVLLGIATRDRWSGFAAVAAVVAVAVRFGTTDFGDVAGIQSVLGPAGIVGPTTAAASAWVGAAAVVFASAPTLPPARPRSPVAADAEHDLLEPAVPTTVMRLLVALAGGSLAAAVVAGPGPGGGLAVRIGATVAATVLCGVVGRIARASRLGTIRTVLAVVAGLAAVALAGWPA